MTPITITKNVLGIEYPITIHAEEILYYWMKEKGNLIEFLKMAIIELNKEDNDIVKLKLKEVIELMKSPSVNQGFYLSVLYFFVHFYTSST